ncbi:MAG: helix-turn-helix domain-containing protein [Saprospiraceae bacterium]|nr:helix-turn-helix domain-containing protein [Saprospiraceae bacterium]
MAQVIVLTPDQLQSFVDSVAQRVESLIKDSQKKQITSKEWLTAREVSELLKISHTTIHDWSKKGILKKHRIGDRIRFRHDEVLDSLLKIESKHGRS